MKIDPRRILNPEFWRHRKAKQNTPSPVTLLEIIGKTAEEWTSRLTATRIREDVRGFLDEHFKEVMLAALGLTNRYSGFEVTSTEKWSGVVKTIDEHAKAEATKWLQEHIHKFPECATNERLINHYNEVYRRELESRVGDLAKERAAADAAHIVEVFGYDMEAIVHLAKNYKPEGHENPVGPVTEEYTWTSPPITSIQECHGMVVIRKDGTLEKVNVDDPNLKVWVVVYLKSELYGAEAAIVSDGNVWKPISPCQFSYGHQLNFANSKVAKKFDHKDQLIFHFMNEADHKLINAAVMAYLEKK